MLGAYVLDAMSLSVNFPTFSIISQRERERDAGRQAGRQAGGQVGRQTDKTKGKTEAEGQRQRERKCCHHLSAMLV